MHYFKEMNRSKLLGFTFVVLVAVGLVGWYFLGSRKSGPPPPVTAPVAEPQAVSAGSIKYEEGAQQLALVRTQTIPVSAVPMADELSARIAYDDDVTARISTSFSGRIVELKAAPGDRVKAGQVLAVIDSPDVGLAQADLNKARADEKRTALAVRRAKDLVPGEAISTRDWEAVQADYAQAQAETARAEQRLKNLNPHDLLIKGQRIILASPIDGVVTERNATPALEVSPGMAAPLFVVTDTRRLWLQIDLPEALLSRVKLGSEVAVATDAFPDQRFRAKIIQLGQVINPNTRRANVLARIDNADGKLRPEMFVRASVLQHTGDGVRVPNEALVIRGIYTYVFVETNPGEFTLRKVNLVKRGIDFSYVGEGLKGDEQVVTKGALLLDAELIALTGGK